MMTVFVWRRVRFASLVERVDTTKGKSLKTTTECIYYLYTPVWYIYIYIYIYRIIPFAVNTAWHNEQREEKEKSKKDKSAVEPETVGILRYSHTQTAHGIQQIFLSAFEEIIYIYIYQAYVVCTYALIELSSTKLRSVVAQDQNYMTLSENRSHLQWSANLAC